MHYNQSYLFKDRRFLPLFITQLCGCLNDSILRNALIMLITYKLSSELMESAQLLVLFANAAFIFPFILLASIAGQIADRYERCYIARIVKISELLIIGLTSYGLMYNNLIILFITIALMGTHSTFFGPIKYSVLPDHLNKEELLSANGFVEAATFVSILIGTLVGGFYNINPQIVIGILFTVSIIGIIFSIFLPKSNNYNPDIKLNINILHETTKMIKHTYSKKPLYLAILGISWFWFIGAAMLSQIPLLAHDTFAADEGVANLFLAVFSIGVGIGSFWCNRIFSNKITTKYVFATALGMGIFGIDLFFASKISAIHYEITELKSVVVFLSKKHNWRIVIDLFAIAMLGGLYVVPLFAMIQSFSAINYRSRVVAVNNLMNAIFMIASTVMLSILFYLGLSVPYVILFVSILNTLVAYHIYKLTPEAQTLPYHICKILFKFIFDALYSVEVKGIENFHKAGKRSVIIANHLSYIDPALIAVYLPEELNFAINTTHSQLYWVKPFLKLSKAFPIDPNNAMAIKSLIKEINNNKKLVIFPEGRITLTGSLMKIYEGPGMIADKTNATMLPIRIDGPQFTHFSKVKNILKTRLMPKVTITILPPVKLTPSEGIEDNRLRRKYIGQALYDIMTDMICESADCNKTLYQSLIESAKVYGFNKVIMEDIENNSVTYRGLLLKSFILANVITKYSVEKQYIGIMLPNMVVTAITFYAVQACGRVPTMVNFTAGADSIINSCNTARANVILTSKKFVKKAELETLIAQLISAKFNIVYLEDVSKQITIWSKLIGMFGSMFPQFYYYNFCKHHDSSKPAVVLFTSGTESQPKAVVLSHQNIQANVNQVISKLDLNPYDVLFNALPMFHCFGLNGSVLAAITGVKTFFYPSPLHYRIIPEIIYDVSATIIFSTDTFLNGYAKYAHPYDFCSLRYIFAGAEKLKPQTRQLWLDKYGIRIFEGYGVTECSPVLSMNTPMHDLPGSVGRFVPKIKYILQPVEGIENGGRLCIQGPNLMLGYIRPENPKIIEPTKVDGLGSHWYDTGDIVSVNSDGYITILGRAKRFAKIAGEMISLAKVEEIASNIDNSGTHAVVYISDESRYEQIWLFTDSSIIDKSIYTKFIKNNGLTNLYIPKFIQKIDEIPILATGKINYVKVVDMAHEISKSSDNV